MALNPGVRLAGADFGHRLHRGPGRRHRHHRRRLRDRPNQRAAEARWLLLRSRLDPVTEHLELMAALAARGRIDIQSPIEMRETLCGDDEPRARRGLPGPLRHARPLRITVSSAASTARWRPTTAPRPSNCRKGRTHARGRMQTSHRTFGAPLSSGVRTQGHAASVLNSHAGAAHRRRLHRRPHRHRVGQRPVLSDQQSAARASEQPFFLSWSDQLRTCAGPSPPDRSGAGLACGASEAHRVPTVDEVDDPVLAYIRGPAWCTAARHERARGGLGHVGRDRGAGAGCSSTASSTGSRAQP